MNHGIIGQDNAVSSEIYVCGLWLTTERRFNPVKIADDMIPAYDSKDSKGIVKERLTNKLTKIVPIKYGSRF